MEEKENRLTLISFGTQNGAASLNQVWWTSQICDQ